MANGKNCPDCKEDIGWWAVFSAGMPTWVRCPNCRAKLQYRDSVGVIVVLGVIALGITAIIYFSPVRELVPDPEHVKYYLGGLILASWALIELGATWFLRNRRDLMTIGPANKP